MTVAIYLDHAASTPLSPQAIAAYTEALGLVGNPASIHGHGQAARRLLEESREAIAAALGADRVEVTLTSGGTESVNLAVKGLWWARARARWSLERRPFLAGAAPPAPTGVPPVGTKRNRILVPRAEHHATLDAVRWLETHEGAVVEWLPVDELGRLDLPALERALGPDVALLTLLAANNEVGTLQPVAEAIALADAHGVPVHVDAIGAVGAVTVDFHELGAAALSVTAHKLGGPVGVGALLISRSATVVPLLHGGDQQRSRSGTQDAAGAAAFAAALTEAVRLEHVPQVTALRDRLIAGVLQSVPGSRLRGDPELRLPGNAHVTVAGCEGDSLLYLLDASGISVSTGSACQAGVAEPSHVLAAMGVPESEARGALRVTLGSASTDADVDAFLAAIPDAAARARAAAAP